MKKNIKKSVTNTKPAQPAVLRVVNSITPEKTTLENLPARQRIFY